MTDLKAMFEQPPPAAGCAFHENIIFLYGPPKIGKTTFAAQFPGALFLTTEPGTKHVEVREIRVNNWATFCNSIKKIEEAVRAGAPIQTLIIDTADNLTDYTDEFICNKMSNDGNRVEILGDVGFGRGFARYTKEVKKQVLSLADIGLGMVFISHAEEKTVKVDTLTNPLAAAGANNKGEASMIVPTIEKRSRKFLLGLSDMILYAEITKDGRRVLRSQPSVSFEAGDRSGRLPDGIDLDYGKVVAAYYGESANEELVGRVTRALAYLSEHKIDGFDVAKRVTNSLGDHLGVKKVDELSGCSIPDLEKYLQHLRIVAKAGKAEKGGEAA